MKKFKYLKISNTKKLRYIDNYFKKRLYIIFLPGFMSDIEGEKPKTLFKFAKKNKLGFLSLEYSGHGKSSGIFTKGNISIWSRDTKSVIRKIVKKNNFILILLRGDDHEKIDNRFEFTKELIGSKVDTIDVRNISSDNLIIDLFHLVLIGDLVSVDLANQLDIDPFDIEAIENLKKKLKG